MQKIRLQVITKGGTDHIIERFTGKSEAFRWTRQGTLHLGQVLKVSAVNTKISLLRNKKEITDQVMQGTY